MVIAAILAGGTGSRMGLEIPKQFAEIAGKPVLAHTCEKFLEHPEINHVVALVPAEWVDFTKELLGGVEVVAGGSTRNETLRNALNYVREKFGEEEHILMTHDAARPFVTHRIITENIKAAYEHGACGTAIPAADTIVRSEDGNVMSEIPARSQMYQAQTPQSFRCAALARMMDALTPEEEAGLTDACMIFALKGEPVKMVRGEPANIKITYPQDLEIANALFQIINREAAP